MSGGGISGAVSRAGQQQQQQQQQVHHPVHRRPLTFLIRHTHSQSVAFFCCRTIRYTPLKTPVASRPAGQSVGRPTGGQSRDRTGRPRGAYLLTAGTSRRTEILVAWREMQSKVLHQEPDELVASTGLQGRMTSKTGQE